MSDYNFKVKIIGLLDMLAFKAIVPKRKAILDAGPDKKITGIYGANLLAAKLHPKKQEMKISEITDIPGADAKHYILKGNELAVFRAGQYIAVDLNIGGSVLSRAYTLCSDPLKAKEGVYELAIKRTEDGFASAWILDNWKVGDTVTASGPEGFCYYESLRDEPRVIGVAGGSGITPLLSMARAIASGAEDFDLTILYGSRTEDSIMMKDELDGLVSSSDRIKVIYVLSEEEKEGYEHGFITAELIKKYAPEGPYSVFMCGPDAMYSFVGKECEKLGLDKKHVRKEATPAPASPAVFPDYPGSIEKEFTLTLKIYGEELEVPMKASESVLTALDRAGIKANAHCRGGECGFCRTKLLSGEYFIPAQFDKRRMADDEGGYIHPCCTYPLSDMSLLLWHE